MLKEHPSKRTSPKLTQTSAKNSQRKHFDLLKVRSLGNAKSKVFFLLDFEVIQEKKGL